VSQSQQQVVAAIPVHGYASSQPVAGSAHDVQPTFVWTRDEIYVPIAVRKPRGAGPFPVITMGRGNGRGGMPHVIREVERCASMQDLMIERGYVVVYVNYRNEVPHLYNEIDAAQLIQDDMTDVGRVRRSTASLDSDDFTAVLRYLQTLPYVDPDAIGAMGVSHGGEIILKAASETTFGAGVIIDGVLCRGTAGFGGCCAVCDCPRAVLAPGAALNTAPHITTATTTLRMGLIRLASTPVEDTRFH
jgi:hypothetical protein